MQLSSLLIVFTPNSMDAALGVVQTMPGVSVHHVDTDGHRAIVVTEAPDIGQCCDIFKAIEKVDGVASVSLIGVVDDEAL